MSRLRRWLARKLWPEVFEKAERGWYRQQLIQQLHRWCGEFRDVSDAAEWMLACEASRYRQIGESDHSKASDISDFREMLRRRRDKAA